MSHSSETSGVEPTAASAEKPEQNVEKMHLSLDLTVNKDVYFSHEYFLTHEEGEIDTLYRILIDRLRDQKRGLEKAKNPNRTKFDRPITQEELKEEIDFNEHTIANLDSLIGKLRGAVDEAKMEWPHETGD